MCKPQIAPNLVYLQLTIQILINFFSSLEADLILKLNSKVVLSLLPKSWRSCFCCCQWWFFWLFLFCFGLFFLNNLNNIQAQVTVNEVATVSCHSVDVLILNVLESTGNLFVTNRVALSLNKKEFVCNTWCRLGIECVSKGVFCPVVLV